VNSRGVLVEEVAHGSPAERAGIKAGDVVVSINGMALESAAQLRNAIALLRVGQTVELRVWHKGAIRIVTASIT
jgi:serine protease Do